MKESAPETPDGQYIVVRRSPRLWQSRNPHLPEEVRTSLASELISARRAKRMPLAIRSGFVKQGRGGRREDRVGERGPVW